MNKKTQFELGRNAPLVLNVFFFPVNSLQSPYKKLKEALSSVEAFERHYLVSRPRSNLLLMYFSRNSCSSIRFLM